MLLLSLALVLTSALAADLSPEELIARLGSPDRVVREEAARTLEEQGLPALPALRAAREAARAPEARSRLADLIARAEARTLDRPTMVVLDIEDRPLGEAVATLATRSGFAIALEDPALADRRVTVRAKDPLPFWEALDRLSRAGKVRHDPGTRPDNNGNDPEASIIRLVDGEPPTPTAYSGPLRVHLFATHRHRDLSFEAPNAFRTPQVNMPVSVEVQAFAEPGRFLNPNGLPRLAAVDEQGRTIFPAASWGGEVPNPSEHSWLTPGRLSLMHWRIPLGIPDLPAGSPLKLRGVLPVVISTRRPDPLDIPLADAAGKTFRLGSSIARIEKITTQARTTTVNFFLSEDGAPPDRTRASAGPETDYVGDFLRNRIEFEDAEGHPLSWNLIGDPRGGTTNGELRVQTFVSGAAPPARLLIYRLNRLATEIPFEFDKAPAP